MYLTASKIKKLLQLTLTNCRRAWDYNDYQNTIDILWWYEWYTEEGFHQSSYLVTAKIDKKTGEIKRVTAPGINKYHRYEYAYVIEILENNLDNQMEEILKILNEEEKNEN